MTRALDTIADKMERISQDIRDEDNRREDLSYEIDVLVRALREQSHMIEMEIAA